MDRALGLVRGERERGRSGQRRTRVRHRSLGLLLVRLGHAAEVANNYAPTSSSELVSRVLEEQAGDWVHASELRRKPSSSGNCASFLCNRGAHLPPVYFRRMTVGKGA